MLPLPHVLLFLPICFFAGLFVATVAVNVVAVVISRPRPIRRDPYWQEAARGTSGNRAVGRTGAQIIYFKPRKTALPSRLGLGAS